MRISSPPYLNFDLDIVPAQESYRVYVHAPMGMTPSTTFPEKELAEFWHRNNAIDFLTAEPTIVQTLGASLFNLVFRSETLTCLRQSLTHARQQNSYLRFRLRLDDAPELQQWPWEYIFDTSHFLAHSQDTSFTHFAASPEPITPFTYSSPLRILCVIANPIDLQALEVEQEWSNLVVALAEPIKQGKVVIDRLDKPTLLALQSQLRKSDYHILHFIGHGEFDERNQEGYLYFTDGSASKVKVSAQNLAIVLHNAPTVRLVVLNACRGAITSIAQPFAGVAHRLLQQKLPMVIAMQRPFSDQAAIAFSHQFYSALADGYPIEAALTEARVTMKTQLDNNEWGTPRLFMHSSLGQLWQMNPQKQTLPSDPPIRWVSEDGRIENEEQPLYPPLPEFDPSILSDLEPPGGALQPRDKFYVERDEDARLRSQLVRQGSTTLIRGPRQTGKTSMLSRGLYYANEQKIRSVYISFVTMVETGKLTTLDAFLHELGSMLCRRLRIDQALFEHAWVSSLDAPQKLTFFLEDHILPHNDKQIILAIDEADSLFSTSYSQAVFSLLRSWHEQRAFDPERWNLLNLVLVISTEPYLLIQDIHQSPFNVGARQELSDFTESQVQFLNQRHGAPIKPTEMSQFMDLLGGHPYLTRVALYEMVIHNRSWSMIAREAVTEQSIFREHLQRLFSNIYQQTLLKSALLTIIRTQRCPDQVALIRLLRAGVIKGSGEHFSCRCELYRRYLETRL